MNNSPTKRSWRLALLAFTCGVVFVGVAAATVHGTDQRAFCSQCHTMGEASWTHSISTHAQFSCNECHTPSPLMQKLPFKAKVGFHDVFVTMTGSVPSSIHASAEMKGVIQANCLRCHQTTVSTVSMDVKPFCTDCHRAVPHFSKLPMDKREAADV